MFTNHKIIGNLIIYLILLKYLRKVDNFLFSHMSFWDMLRIFPFFLFLSLQIEKSSFRNRPTSYHTTEPLFINI
jgi:hypothetical protein